MSSIVIVVVAIYIYALSSSPSNFNPPSPHMHPEHQKQQAENSPHAQTAILRRMHPWLLIFDARIETPRIGLSISMAEGPSASPQICMYVYVMGTASCAIQRLKVLASGAAAAARRARAYAVEQRRTCSALRRTSPLVPSFRLFG